MISNITWEAFPTTLKLGEQVTVKISLSVMQNYPNFCKGILSFKTQILHLVVITINRKKYWLSVR